MVAMVHAYVIRGGRAHTHPVRRGLCCIHALDISRRPGGAHDSGPALVATDASPRCTLVICAHESILLTNPEPCILIEERTSFMPSRLEHGLYKKVDRLKNIFYI